MGAFPHSYCLVKYGRALIQDRQAKPSKIAKPLAILKWQKIKRVYYFVVKNDRKKVKGANIAKFLIVPIKDFFDDLKKIAQELKRIIIVQTQTHI